MEFQVLCVGKICFEGADALQRIGVFKTPVVLHPGRAVIMGPNKEKIKAVIFFDAENPVALSDVKLYGILNPAISVTGKFACVLKGALAIFHKLFDDGIGLSTGGHGKLVGTPHGFQLLFKPVGEVNAAYHVGLRIS